MKKTNTKNSSPNKKEKNLQILQELERKLTIDEKILREEEVTLGEIRDDFMKVRNILLSTGFSDFVRYLHSPWQIIWSNFLGGIFRGLGIIIGMTLVFAMVIWALTLFVDFPLIGNYFKDLKELLEGYMPSSKVY